MARSAEFVRSSFRIKVYVDGTEYDALSCTIRFAVNEITQAQAVIAVGFNVKTGLLSNIHNRGEASFEAAVPVLITVEPKGDRTINTAWPDGVVEATLFEGRLSGLAFRRTTGSLEAVVAAIHWASDLAATSALSNLSHPTNPAAFTTQLTGAIVAPGTGGASTAPVKGFTSISVFRNNLIPSLVASDLWEQGIKKNLYAIANQTFQGASTAATTLPARENNAAVEALDRFLPADQLGQGSIPLALKSGLSSAAVLEAITKDIAQATVGSFEGTTLWHKLSSFAAMYMFGISFTPESAIVFPDVRCLRQEWRTIHLWEYSVSDLSFALPRPISAVGIYSDKTSRNGVQGSADKQARVAFGGVFFSDQRNNKNASVLVRTAPAWLQNVQTGVIPTVYVLNEPSNGSGDKTPRPFSSNEADSRGVELYSAYAQALYLNETLRGRNGRLTAPIRFDIAPGSTVRIEGTNASPSQALNRPIGQPSSGSGDLMPPAGDDVLGDDLFAFVESVTLGFNAVAGNAAVGFDLSHIRTAKENEGDSYSSAEHPLYADVWPGGPLIPDLAG